MSQSNIERGEKWNREFKMAEFRKDIKKIEWMNAQKSIMDDIQEYQNSIKKPEEPKPIKSKGKK